MNKTAITGQRSKALNLAGHGLFAISCADTVSALLVEQTAVRLSPLVEQVGGLSPESIPGYRMRILDGNHLAGTEHRLPETRGDSAASLPGQTLVVLEPARRLITDIVCCQDGHAQERSLLEEIVAKVQERGVWMADRNFCVRHFLPSIATRGGFFVIREHAVKFRSVRCRRRIGVVERRHVSLPIGVYLCFPSASGDRGRALGDARGGCSGCGGEGSGCGCCFG